MTGGAVPQFSQLPLSSMENLTQDFLSKLTISTCTRKSRVYGSCKDIFGNAHNVLPVGTAFFKMISGKKEGETTYV